MLKQSLRIRKAQVMVTCAEIQPAKAMLSKRAARVEVGHVQRRSLPAILGKTATNTRSSGKGRAVAAEMAQARMNRFFLAWIVWETREIIDAIPSFPRLDT